MIEDDPFGNTFDKPEEAKEEDKQVDKVLAQEGKKIQLKQMYDAFITDIEPLRPKIQKLIEWVYWYMEFN